jgi:hypothetical protein
LADAQHLPQGRRQAGDRHLKFHETRDNLRGGRETDWPVHYPPTVNQHLGCILASVARR